MAEQGSAGQSWAGRIAAVIVIVVLIIGGYYALSSRPEQKAGQAVEVSVVPPAADGAAKPDSTAPAETAAAPAVPAASPTPSPAAPDATAAARPSEPAPATPVAPAPGSQQTAAAPASASPAAPAAGTAAPSFDVVRVEPSGEAVVAGTAEPNANVQIMDGAKTIAEGTANDRGEWAMTLDTPLDPGSHDLSIRTTSPDKKTETLSEQSVAVSVPEKPGSSPLVVLDNPGGATKVLQTPQPSDGTAAGPKPDVTVDAVAFQDGKLYISGSAAIGGIVRIYVDGVVVGDAAVDEDGRWQIATDRAVGSGQHTIRADRIEKETGQVIARAEVPFQQTGDVATLLDVGTAGGGSAGVSSTGSADLQKVVIKRGDNLWTISRKLYGKGMRFSTIYEANNDQIRNPDLIYPGQVFLLPAGDTRWKE
jgi:nucleoid-associated protein YgaU